ncbi:hypothetical protein EON64_07460 [archaeon]|nr:MAG: hypothetical protein EON64_07460 [archaeon]
MSKFIILFKIKFVTLYVGIKLHIISLSHPIIYLSIVIHWCSNWFSPCEDWDGAHPVFGVPEFGAAEAPIVHPFSFSSLPSALLDLTLFSTSYSSSTPMGAAGSNPIDDATQERINNRIQEILKTFSIEFSKVSFCRYLCFLSASFPLKSPTSRSNTFIYLIW